MSTTTTTTTTTNTHPTLSVLADYELHHSVVQTEDSPPAIPPSRTTNPPSWPTNHRRIPAYRPINRELDQSERRVYQNRFEQAFISAMFMGLLTNVVVSRMWRATGGRINDRIFYYKIGGEW